MSLGWDGLAKKGSKIVIVRDMRHQQGADFAVPGQGGTFWRQTGSREPLLSPAVTMLAGSPQKNLSKNKVLFQFLFYFAHTHSHILWAQGKCPKEKFWLLSAHVPAYRPSRFRAWEGSWALLCPGCRHPYQAVRDCLPQLFLLHHWGWAAPLSMPPSLQNSQSHSGLFPHAHGANLGISVLLSLPELISYLDREHRDSSGAGCICWASAGTTGERQTIV